MNASTLATLVLLPTAGMYVGSLFGEVRGIHDWIVPGAVFRTEAPHRVLTFDDGPDPERTPRLLDVLAENETRAIFFVVGEAAQRHPDIVRRIVGAGHLLGNHSWNHPWFVPRSARFIADQLDRCQQVLGEITGHAPTLVRPPYGQRDFRFNRLARERGLVPVLWSRNLRDYWGTSAEGLVRRLRRSRPGEIILMHDGDPTARHTVEAVHRWLETKPSVGLLEPADRQRSERPASGFPSA